MKYNSIENAEKFITEQIEWARTNGHGNFIIWSNGEELAATIIDDNDLGNIFTRCDLEKQGFWKAMVFEGGYRVEA